MPGSSPLSTRRPPFLLTPLLVALAAAALWVAPPAHAAQGLLSTTVSAASGAHRECAARAASGAGVVTRQVTAPMSGIVGAKLNAASGDWDLAVFESATGRTVAASAGLNAVEVASGFVGRAATLTVQACRLSGSAGSASVDVSFAPIPTGTLAERAQLVRVATPTPFHKDLLNLLDLDVTEHGRADFVEVVLYGSEDAGTLRQAGLDYEVVIADLAARDRANARKDIAFAAATSQSPLPSGIDAYRHLWEYEYALKELQRHYPAIAKPFTLPFKTNEGREVHGVQITKNVANWRDGKPAYLQMGVHHAREWPSGEHAMEFAFDLAMNYGRSARTTALVDKVRTIVVPVVNPDGFNLSREAPVDLRDVTGVGYNNTVYAYMTLTEPFFAYKRRNCRPVDGQASPPPVCGTQPFRYTGIDPNRNYGGLWGGPGASSLPAYDTYRGAAPFSEPETRNIRDLVSRHQVTTLITNHTFSNLVLRPPGLRAAGPPPDEPIYNDLGQRMAAQNGYKNQPSYDLYDTTGTTEDWSYYATGGLGYTFEIGPNEFHPPFEQYIDEYLGAGAYAGKGNREAFYIAMENAADAAKHSVIAGSAPPGALLRLRKVFVTETSPVRTFSNGAITLEEVEAEPANVGAKIRFLDTLDTFMKVPASGTFEWHVNPSTRPIAAEKRIRGVAESPYQTQTWQNSDPSIPGDEIDKEFTIAGSEPVRLLKVSLDWETPDDWDLEIYHRQPDGSLKDVGGSGGPPGAKEIAYVDDAPPGDYVLRVVNFAAANPNWTMTAELFGPGPDIIIGGGKEAYLLTCHKSGQFKTQKAYVDRGGRLNVGNACG
jgi:hypothetical protein